MSMEPRRPMMPPVPRDHDDATFSELVPFRSGKIRLARSPLLLVAILTAVIVPFMFTLLGPALEGQDARTQLNAVITMNVVCVFFLTMLLQIVIFFYSRTDRSIWTFMIPFAVVAAIMHFPILARPFFFVFREVLPGDYDPAQQYSFVGQFVKMFFAAGLCEELIKATPLLIGAFLTLRARTDPALADNGFYRLAHLRGPLDGVVMGVFAGGGFIFIETAFEYVPRMVGNVLQQTNDPGLAMASGLLLLLPRALGGLVGHMAYAGLFGYFIGLAVIRPRQGWKLLGIGWVAAAVIHALWNSVSVISPVLQYGVAIAAAVVVVAALLKARQLEASQLGRTNESFGSIVVDRPPVARAAAPVPPRPAPAPPSPPVTAMPHAIPTPPAAVPELLALDVEGLRIPLRAGMTMDLEGEPALGGRGAGVIGAIVAHPTRAGVLGLRNGGGESWNARLRDGRQQSIGPDQNIRLAPGVEIDFGGGLTGRVVGA